MDFCNAFIRGKSGNTCTCTCTCVFYNLYIDYIITIVCITYSSTHHTPGLELPNEGPPLEQVSLILSHEVSIGSCILVLCPVAGSLMVPTDDSTIMRINWEGIIDKSHCIDLKKLSFINDQPLDSKGIIMYIKVL